MGGVDASKGVPYGAPTGGADRVMRPKKAKPWAGAHDTVERRRDTGHYRTGRRGGRRRGGRRRESHADRISDPPAGPVISCDVAPATAGQSRCVRGASAESVSAESQQGGAGPGD